MTSLGDINSLFNNKKNGINTYVGTNNLKK